MSTTFNMIQNMILRIARTYRQRQNYNWSQHRAKRQCSLIFGDICYISFNNLILLEFIRSPGPHDALRTIASTSYFRHTIVKASVLRIKYHMFHNG